jgi:hypothetical protein
VHVEARELFGTVPRWASRLIGLALVIGGLALSFASIWRWQATQAPARGDVILFPLLIAGGLSLAWYGGRVTAREAPLRTADSYPVWAYAVAALVSAILAAASALEGRWMAALGLGGLTAGCVKLAIDRKKVLQALKSIQERQSADTDALPTTDRTARIRS